MSGAASAATIAAATTAAAIVAANATVDNPSHPARSANENRRDPQLRAFEHYLLDNLRQSDVTKDNEGVYLFNVNQVAYLVEGCCTRDEQRATRNRLKDALHSLSYVIKRVASGNKGDSQLSHQLLVLIWVGSELSHQLWVLIWVGSELSHQLRVLIWVGSEF